jgi:hypothetical protein
MRDLAAAVSTDRGAAATLAARVAAIDPASSALQQAAVAIARANLPHARRDAIAGAMRELAAYAQAGLASPADVDAATDPLAGWMADALARLPKRGGR